jgi:hypothetical protein
MEHHRSLTDGELERNFNDCTLEPSWFTHEAHLRLAWIQLSLYDVDQACKQICRQIIQFDNTHGKGDKFHKTITIAAVKIVAHFKEKTKSDSFSDLLTAVPRLKTHFKYLLNQHYSEDIFKSPVAATTYLEPDLFPFDLR